MAKGLRAQRKAHKQLLNERARQTLLYDTISGSTWRFSRYVPAPAPTYTFDFTDDTITTGTGNLIITTTTGDTGTHPTNFTNHYYNWPHAGDND